MKKLQIALIVIFVFLLVFVSFSISQDIKKLKAGMPNTVTLSNGEVVYDLNGEWDSFRELYGSWSVYSDHKNVAKITQKGAVFVGVQEIEGHYLGKGKKLLRGELTKGGFKKVEVLTLVGYLDCTGKISEDGNKIILDDGEKLRVKLTRR